MKLSQNYVSKWLPKNSFVFVRPSNLVRNRPLEHIPITSMGELSQELESLENGAAAGLTDEELLTTLNSLHDGFEISTPIIPAGTLIHRAVRITRRPTDKSQVGYPPKEFIKVNGRVNRAGHPMFYGSPNPFVCLIECGWQVGEFFALSAWLTNRDMLFNRLGYSVKTFKAKKSGRDVPTFDDPTLGSNRSQVLREWQARVFTQHVPRGQEERYRLPIALSNLMTAEMEHSNPALPKKFSGVIYPSVAINLLADNLAIAPSEVDSCLNLCEVILVTLDQKVHVELDEEKSKDSMFMKWYDFARPDTQANLVWGQKSQVFHPRGVDASQCLPPKILAPE